MYDVYHYMFEIKETNKLESGVIADFGVFEGIV